MALASSLAFSGMVVSPVAVRAVDESTLVDSELVERVEQCTSDYHDAQQKVDELNEQIKSNQERIEVIEAQLPEQKGKAAASLRTLYKFHQSSNGLIDLVLSAEDFNEFIATVQYLDIIQSRNYEELVRLVEMEDQLNIARADLDHKQTEAEDELKRAEEALTEAEEAREAVRQRALEVQAAEAAARAQALEDARAHQGETFTTPSGATVTVTVPTVSDTTLPSEPANTTPASTPTSTPEPANTEQEQPDENQNETTPEAQPEPQPEPEPEPTPAPATNSRDTFIQVWGARIDAYNAGYPLGGCGEVFAAAAYDCGVDPRWSPAIARIESTSGTYCFADHNAWGWGDVDWPDWNTAIWDHVDGLASIYGYTNTYEAAAMYCPPNASFWYSCVASEMSSIWPTDQL